KKHDAPRCCSRSASRDVHASENCGPLPVCALSGEPRTAPPAYSSRMKAAVSFPIALVVLGFALSAGAEDLAARQVTVDATVTVGTLRPFSGVQAVDAEGTAFYRAARVDLVR